MDSIIIKEKIKEFSKNSKIHLSFDLDVIDANDFNSINTPVEKGFSILKTKYILDTIYNYCNINSMDIVEINFLKSLTSDIFDDYETLRVLLSKYDIFN